MVSSTVAALVEAVDEPADVLVHRGDAAQVVLHVALVLPDAQLLVGRARRAGLP